MQVGVKSVYQIKHSLIICRQRHSFTKSPNFKTVIAVSSFRLKKNHDWSKVS